MSEIGNLFKALKALRRDYKRDNPKCTKCGNQLQLSQFAEGKSDCRKCEGLA